MEKSKEEAGSPAVTGSAQWTLTLQPPDAERFFSAVRSSQVSLRCNRQLTRTERIELIALLEEIEANPRTSDPSRKLTQTK